jgi:uncharacterized membrane protein
MRGVWDKLRHHPLHPVVVHFPIVLWTGSSLLDAGAWTILPDPMYWRLSRILLFAGIFSAMPAMLFGIWDFLRRQKAFSDSALRTLGIHAMAAGLAFMLYTLALVFHGADFTRSNLQFAATLLQIGGWVSLIVAGFSGADLIYSHGVWASQEKQTRQ